MVPSTRPVDFYHPAECCPDEGVGHLTFAELARSLPLDPSASTRVVDRLERTGPCKRVRSSADRRVIKLELARNGEGAMSEVQVMLCKVMDDHLTDFSTNKWNEPDLYLLRMAKNA